MAHTKATVQKRAMMSMPLIPSSCSGKGVAKKMGKSGKGKTPHIRVKNLKKIQPHAVTKPFMGKMILARDVGPEGNQKVSEVNRTTDSQDAILEGSQRDLTEGRCIPPDTSGGCVGTT